ncbi:MAG: rod shape-determining protein MreD [Pontixanthobacter sp.]
MDRVNPRARFDEYGSRINRSHSPLLASSVAPLSIMLASLLPNLVLSGAVPFIPPLGFIFLIAWRMVRPGLLPVWIGFPLGMFDDLFSGQPFGSAIMLWSLTMIAIEMVEARFPWRSHFQDWMTMSALIAAYLIIAAIFSGGVLSLTVFVALGPQLLISALLLPLITRIVAALDRLRLKRIRTVR